MKAKSKVRGEAESRDKARMKTKILAARRRETEARVKIKILASRRSSSAYEGCAGAGPMPRSSSSRGRSERIPAFRRFTGWVATACSTLTRLRPTSEQLSRRSDYQRHEEHRGRDEAAIT